MKVLISLAALVAWALLVAPVAHAATYYIATTGNDTNSGSQAQPFRTIGKGIAGAAANGDTILVANGTYNEHDLDFGARNLVLQSQSGSAAACILDCQQLGRGFHIAGGQTAAAVSGLTIRNALSLINHRGAAVYIANSDVTVTNCTFSGNRFAYSGGLGADAIYVDNGGNLNLADCRFSSNGLQPPPEIPIGPIGVVVVMAGYVSVSNCAFTNNTSTCLALFGGVTTLLNGTFTSNVTFYGAVWQSGGGLVADKCVFTSNYNDNPDTGGGGMYVAGGNLTLTDCLFANNSCALVSYRLNGESITFDTPGGSANIVNCTFTGQWTCGSTVPVNISNISYNLTLVNSIIWGSACYDIFTYDPWAVTTVMYSDLQNTTGGTGNISANPLFVNAAAGNYRLQAASPCINTGTASATNLPATDLEGAPRILGGAPDMGAYEHWNSLSGAWFVNTALGNDLNPGSPTAPFKTVVKAITVATNGHSISVKQGNYGSDKPRITKALRLFNWDDIGLARIGQP